MHNSAVNRARQLSRKSPEFADMLAYVHGNEMRTRLIQAAAAGIPPVSVASDPLVARFGQAAFASTSARQFIGLAISALLEGEGFLPNGKRVRLRNDPVFETGALFREAPRPALLSVRELLARFVEALSEAEIDLVAELIATRRTLGQLPPNVTGRSRSAPERD